MNFLKPTRITWITFGFLVLATGIFVLLANISGIDVIQRVFYISLIWPAAAFEYIGLNTLGGGGALFIALPTNLGLALTIIFYLILFYFIGSLVNRIRTLGLSKKSIIIFIIIILVTIAYSQIKDSYNTNSIPEDCRSFNMSDRPDCLKHYQ